jgi:predicted RND superfamily exporter protein
MLYTSLTSAAGFASLALTPIPPVQVFGIFVAIGIMFAWVLTITFIPAYTTLIREKSLETFGLARGEEGEDSILTRILKGLGGLTYRRAKVILSITVIAGAVAFYGISLIQINDNPVKWFTGSHPIRVADEVLNSHFGGTYMAYLVLEPKQAEQSVREVAKSLDGRLRILKAEMHADFPEALPVIEKFRQMVHNSAQEVSSGAGLLDLLLQRIAKRMDTASDDELEALEEIVAVFDSERATGWTFKRPDVLRYIARLQDALLETEVVGKSNAVTDIVKKVYKELMEGKEAYYRIPDTPEAVAQCLITFQNSHDPDDLWHLVTPDYGKANIWVQLKSGDNKDMERVTKAVDLFFQKNPAPIALGHRWFGLTYINVVWQNKMVSGMLKAFLGSFLVVFIMMTVLFRSPLWAALSMIPLTVTIALIYGVIGFVGKDYDMPVAVLSALTLGLAVDFSIHFLTRSRMAAQEHGSWELASRPVFGEPARAISRNIVVIAIGFLPLLAAPLLPYKTVGVFMAAILIISGVATLFILPALMRVLARFLFLFNAPRSAIRDWGACFVISTATVILIVLSIHQFGAVSWTILTWLSIILIPILTIMCNFMSRKVGINPTESPITPSKRG